MLQHEDACSRRDWTCFLRWFSATHDITWVQYDATHIPSGSFVEGGLRTLDDPRDVESDPSSNETSTVEPDSEDDISDAVSWMSGASIMAHFDPPDPYPWQTFEFAEEEVQDHEDLPDVAFAPGHLPMLQNFIELATEGEDSTEQQWTILTFGLGLLDLGRRDMRIPLHEPIATACQKFVGRSRTIWRSHIDVRHSTTQ